MPENSTLEEKRMDLYRPGQPTSSGIPNPAPTPPPITPTPPPPPQQESKSRWDWIDRIPLKKSLWVLGILVLLTVSVILWRGFFRFDQNRVQISLEPHSDVPTGEVIEWDITISNKNIRALSAGELTFTFPEQTFSPDTGEKLSRTTISVPSIGRWGEETLSLSGIFVSGGQKDARIEYKFTQGGSSTRFERRETVAVSPKKLPVELKVEVPAETLSGEEIEVRYKIKSEAKAKLLQTRLRLVYPLNFIATRSSVPLENAYTFWRLDELEEEEELELIVFGRVSGGSGESRIFRAFFEGKTGDTTWETYAEASGTVELAETPLSLSVDAAENIVPGGNLTYNIEWKNNFDVSISHLSIAATLSGQMIDFTSLDADGSFNSREGTITFSEAHEPKLALVGPGETGEISFNIKVARDYVPTGVTNPAVFARVVASSPTVPEGLTTSGVRAIQEIETRVQGTLIPEARVFYNETLAPIRNSGPYPPRLGSDTTFTVHWRLSGRANLFDSIEVVAQLPSGVDFADETFVNGQYGNLSFNSFTRMVTWTIPELKPNQGLVSQVPEAVFKIKALPAPSQVGRVMELLGDTFVSGHDSFADVTVTSSIPSLTSQIGESEGQVQ